MLFAAVPALESPRGRFALVLWIAIIPINLNALPAVIGRLNYTLLDAAVFSFVLPSARAAAPCK
jgi:hypothetical protein